MDVYNLIRQLGETEPARSQASRELRKQWSYANHAVYANITNADPKIRHACLWLIHRCHHPNLVDGLELALDDHHPKIISLARQLLLERLKNESKSTLFTYWRTRSPIFVSLVDLVLLEKGWDPHVKAQPSLTSYLQPKTDTPQKPAFRQRPQAPRTAASKTNSGPVLRQNYRIYSDTQAPGRLPGRPTPAPEPVGPTQGNKQCRFCKDWFPLKGIGSHQDSCVMNPRA